MIVNDIENIKVGDCIWGKVTGIEKYGIFLSFEDGRSGLVHISEVSYSFVNDVNDYAKIGDRLLVKVLEINSDGNHFKLSIRGVRDSEHKFKKSKIKETQFGFTNLKKNLDKWILDFYSKN